MNGLPRFVRENAFYTLVVRIIHSRLMKIKDKSLLHIKLCDIVKEIIGLDIDEDGIKILSSYLPDKIIILHNAEDLENCKDIHNYAFDIILAADVIEHLSNPGLFLKGVKNLLNHGNRLLITTPQAYGIKRFIRMILKGIEDVHFEHTFYFSISTLSQLLFRYGLEIEEVFAFQWQGKTLLNYYSNLVLMPLFWLCKCRLCDELALVIRKQN